MKQILMNGDAPFLPEEIMTNILRRLPVKSLIRFRCVCKYWENLFKTPSFIADHLHHSTHHNPSLLFFKNYRYGPFHLRLLDCEMQVRDVKNAATFDSLMRHATFSIIGSNNGLLCVAISKAALSPPSLVLWNPATREIRQAPTFSTIRSYGYTCALGFGFSTFVNDYKIVAINRMIRRAGVYSLSRDSWKEIEFGKRLEHLDIFHETGSCSNGAILWHGLKPGDEKRKEGVIVSFDIATEAFTFIPWPGVRRNPCFYYNLTVFEDKLALLDNGIESSPNIDLWVMEEDAGWRKKFSGGPYPWMFDCGGTIWRNEIVVSGTEIDGKLQKNKQESGICLLNITTNEAKMLVIPKYSPCDFLNHVESLVPINRQHPPQT